MATVGAQVGTKEGVALRLIEQNSIPVVGKVRGFEHLQTMRAEFNFDKMLWKKRLLPYLVRDGSKESKVRFNSFGCAFIEIRQPTIAA